MPFLSGTMACPNGLACPLGPLPYSFLSLHPGQDATEALGHSDGPSLLSAMEVETGELLCGPSYAAGSSTGAPSNVGPENTAQPPAHSADSASVAASSGRRSHGPTPFACPLCSDRCFAALQPLQNHLDKFHLAADESVPHSFLECYSRRVCPLCKILVPLRGNCRRCHAGPPQQRPHASALNEKPEEDPQDPSAWEDPADLPTGILRFIPRGVLPAWCETLSAELERFLSAPTRLNALQLAAMPHLILAPCARGGHKHERQCAYVVAERIRRWAAGQRKALLQEIQTSVRAGTSRLRPVRRGYPPTQSSALPETTRRAVLRAVRDGSFSKAVKILLNPGSLVGPEAADDLRRLHPQATAPRLPAVESPAAEDFEAPDVARALRSFPPGSGAGPSGLMAAHLPTGPSAEEQHLLAVLARFCSALAFGRLPLEVRDVLCACNLFGLPKKPTGVRPIAVGETLRRTAAKCLVARYQADSAAKLVPLQVGVGTPGATEAVILKIRTGPTPLPRATRC